MSKDLDLMPQKDGFLGIEEQYLNDPKDAKVVVVPFGLEASVSYGGGTRIGPRAIIKASHQVELFDEEHWCEIYRQFGIATLKEQLIAGNISDALDQLEEITEAILAQDKFPLILGGEHSITAGSIRLLLKNIPIWQFYILMLMLI